MHASTLQPCRAAQSPGAPGKRLTAGSPEEQAQQGSGQDMQRASTPQPVLERALQEQHLAAGMATCSQGIATLRIPNRALCAARDPSPPGHKALLCSKVSRAQEIQASATCWLSHPNVHFAAHFLGFVEADLTLRRAIGS